MIRERIGLHDDLRSIVMKMASYESTDGSQPSGVNPGALNVLLGIVKEAENIDPCNGLGAFGPILMLDSLKIYADRIWMLYKDVCKESIVDTIGMIRACQLGIVSDFTLAGAIDNYGAGVDVKDCINKVREQLPDFGRSVPVDESL